MGSVKALNLGMPTWLSGCLLMTLALGLEILLFDLAAQLGCLLPPPGLLHLGLMLQLKKLGCLLLLAVAIDSASARALE